MAAAIVNYAGGVAMRGAVRIATPMAAHVASQAMLHAETLAHQHSANIVQSIWHPGSWLSWGAPRTPGTDVSLAWIALLGILWLASVALVALGACCMGCGCGIAFRTLCSYARNELYEVFNSMLDSIAKRFAYHPQREHLPPGQDEDIAALSTTAAFIESGGDEALEVVAKRLRTSKLEVQSWYVRWQLAKQGPEIVQP